MALVGAWPHSVENLPVATEEAIHSQIRLKRHQFSQDVDVHISVVTLTICDSPKASQSESRNPLPASEPGPEPEINIPLAAAAGPPTLDSGNPTTARDYLHPTWYIRCLIYMVGYLHTRHRVTFRASALILACLGFIFSILAGNLVGPLAIPGTLTTVFARLDIKDSFVVHPLCFKCHHVFEADVSPQTFCPDCEEEVFGGAFREDDSDAWNDPIPESENSGQSPQPRKRKPHVVTPIQPLSTGLRNFFKRPGMVSAVNAWKTGRERPRRPRTAKDLKCMQDADVWNEMKGPDGASFFYGAGCEKEIRLGVSVSLDCEMPPGPKEPTADQLQNHLKILVDDLIMLYEEGILVETPEHPDGIRVRVALVAIIADHPAMCKLAVGLLRDYLLNFSKLYGIEQMKPNHHWAVHIPDQVLDYGPLYSFWAFLTERLNKVLKNLNSNNWSGGLLEVSMMREFHRMAQLDGVLNGILDETSGPDVPLPSQLEHRFIQLLLGAGENKEALGTIQDAAAYERTSSRVLRGSIANPSERIEDDVLRMGLVQYYNKETPKVYLRLAGKEFANTEVLGSFTETYNYALLDGRRVTSTTCSKRGSAGSSLIQIQFGGEPYAGEIRSIFRHKQAGVPSSEAMLLVFVAWMKPSGETPLDDDSFIWHDFPELGVDTWIYKEYAQPGDTDCPPCVHGASVADYDDYGSVPKFAFGVWVW
ncbi:hypothetical protein DFH07DRAFT_967007 [Mycena maculata]|uniref:Uncharacterized protein n=1 Tax=Mycena maculata TaxID=230809 RepID=A0AAD7I867_9AGAR|nr:hypothetical protein DFH07DRAFT_967007 [Mycena maculata]